MTSNEIRQKFLDFFKERGHAVIPSASLVPENDPTVLFNTAGMQPLVPYFLGQKHPLGNRLVDFQKCIRTDDIEEVGDETHHTFFEMLGNWSIGGNFQFPISNFQSMSNDQISNKEPYWKREAIRYSWEFLTSKDWLGIDLDKIAVSVFAGDDDAPFDQESYDAWISLGIKPGRIAKLPKKNNWWGPAGETGPCGPDTEMFVWVGKENVPDNFQETHEDPRWVEVWNNVFMEFNKVSDGKYEKLAQQNVDTGMGLERITAVLGGFDDNYMTDLFSLIIEKIEFISEKKYLDHKKEFRIIADHIRAAVFAINDGAIPSNTGAGYVVRRLIRRALVNARKLDIEKDGFCALVAEPVITKMSGFYPELFKNQAKIFEELHKEENKFGKTLERGLREYESQKSKVKSQNFNSKGKSLILDTKFVFDLYQSSGMPIEVIQEMAQEDGLEVDIEGFKKEFEKHQDLSRSASAGMFKGGLADNSEIATRYHTSTHLLLAAIRQVLGEEIYQKGSNITAERVRFDFNYPEKIPAEKLKEIEDLVNAKIKEAIPVEMIEMPKEEALKNVKVSFDASKYPDIVKVYKIGDFSAEVCGGPHVENTSELGHFKIVKEESSSAGVRRVKGVLG